MCTRYRAGTLSQEQIKACDSIDGWSWDYISPRKFLPFEEARALVHTLGLKGAREYKARYKAKKLPAGIPRVPKCVYKDKGWVSFGDFLGTKTVAYKNRVCLPFEEARAFVHILGLNNQAEWAAYCASGKKPGDITSHPHKTYKNKGWISWGDWLGTKTVATRNRVYLPFEEAREFARSLGLHSMAEWYAYLRSNTKPSNIPAGPQRVYKGKGWAGYGDWLGTGNVRGGQLGNKSARRKTKAIGA